ncbi:MAG: hypothetical protein KKH98_04690 [Spirochaetes bacterium]|nr:hypothetical protein [Spirochaetota bacterium]
MRFKKVKNFIGKLYIPDKQANKEKKHNCDDCFSCQMCSDSRCEVCLENKGIRVIIKKNTNENK